MKVLLLGVGLIYLCTQDVLCQGLDERVADCKHAAQQGKELLDRIEHEPGFGHKVFHETIVRLTEMVEVLNKVNQEAIFAEIALQVSPVGRLAESKQVDETVNRKSVESNEPVNRNTLVLYVNL